MSTKKLSPRNALAATAAMGAALVVGLLVAPRIFRLILWIGRHVSALEGFRDVEFEQVAYRSVLVMAMLVLIPLCRLSGLRTWRDVGLGRHRRAFKRLAVGFLAGVLTLGGTYLWSVLDGGHALRIAATSIGRDMLVFAIGALVVGFIEETLFRRVLFGAGRGSLGYWGSAISTSLFFAAIHFCKPIPQVGIVHTTWISGFSLLGSVFYPGWMEALAPMILTLFLMGMTLCALYDAFGSLYPVIGLHAGWVWIMRLGIQHMERLSDADAVIYGYSSNITRSYLALLMSLLLWIAAVIIRDIRSRKA